MNKDRKKVNEWLSSYFSTKGVPVFCQASRLVAV